MLETLECDACRLNGDRASLPCPKIIKCTSPQLGLGIFQVDLEKLVQVPCAWRLGLFFLWPTCPLEESEDKPVSGCGIIF